MLKKTDKLMSYQNMKFVIEKVSIQNVLKLLCLIEETTNIRDLKDHWEEIIFIPRSKNYLSLMLLKRI